MCLRSRKSDSSRRDHRSVGLHGAELWPFAVIRLLEEKWFQVFELFLKSNARLGFGIGFSMSKSPRGTYFQLYKSLIGFDKSLIWKQQRCIFYWKGLRVLLYYKCYSTTSVTLQKLTNMQLDFKDIWWDPHLWYWFFARNPNLKSKMKFKLENS